MPWECKQCQAEVASDDDAVCPACNVPKSSWTMVSEASRVFKVSGRRIKLRRGEGTESLPPDDPARADDALVKATHARVVEREVAREIASRGHLPPSRDVLTVRLFPKNAKDLTVKLVVNYETEEAEERSFPYEGPGVNEEGFADVRFLFVCGGEPPPEGEVELPGIFVVDLSEETPEGFAPSVEVSALKKKHKLLRTEPAAGRCLRLFLADSDDDPLAEEPYTISFEGGEVTGTTDAEGQLVEELPREVEEAVLTIAGETYELLLDQLDPLDDENEETAVRGGQARLQNLGYEPGAVDGDLGDIMRAALERFQAAQGLTATGELDEATRARLQEQHGC